MNYDARFMRSRKEVSHNVLWSDMCRHSNCVKVHAAVCIIRILIQTIKNLNNGLANSPTYSDTFQQLRLIDNEL